MGSCLCMASPAAVQGQGSSLWVPGTMREHCHSVPRALSPEVSLSVPLCSAEPGLCLSSSVTLVPPWAQESIGAFPSPSSPSERSAAPTQ